jgi:magnesium-transporting ATPase (P-type)
MSEAARANSGTEAVAWHAVPADQVIGRLNTDPATGLDAAEASRRLSQYGPNRLPEGKQRGPRELRPSNQPIRGRHHRPLS